MPQSKGFVPVPYSLMRSSLILDRQLLVLPAQDFRKSRRAKWTTNFKASLICWISVKGPYVSYHNRDMYKTIGFFNNGGFIETPLQQAA